MRDTRIFGGQQHPRARPSSIRGPRAPYACCRQHHLPRPGRCPLSPLARAPVGRRRVRRRPWPGGGRACNHGMAQAHTPPNRGSPCARRAPAGRPPSSIHAIIIQARPQHLPSATGAPPTRPPVHIRHLPIFGLPNPPSPTSRPLHRNTARRRRLTGGEPGWSGGDALRRRCGRPACP
jgi:hypothetical protein